MAATVAADKCSTLPDLELDVQVVAPAEPIKAVVVLWRSPPGLCLGNGWLLPHIEVEGGHAQLALVLQASEWRGVECRVPLGVASRHADCLAKEVCTAIDQSSSFQVCSTQQLSGLLAGQLAGPLAYLAVRRPEHCRADSQAPWRQ